MSNPAKSPISGIPAECLALFVAGAEPARGEHASSCAVVSVEGMVIAQIHGAALLCDTLACTVPHLRERHVPASWRAGDLFICNNPFLGGVAIDVVSMLAPVVVAGEPRGLVGLAVRYPDVGAMARSAFVRRRESRHEGFCISMLRVDFADEPLPEILTGMVRGNVRLPDLAARWLEAQARAVHRAAQSLSDPGGARIDAPTADLGAAGALASLPRGRFGGAAQTTRLRGDASPCKVGAQVDVSADGVAVGLTLENGAALPDDCNAPLAVTRAGVLSALAEAAGAAPWTISAAVDVQAGSEGRLDATYPAAVEGAGALGFACYEAVAAALNSAGVSCGVLSRERFQGVQS